MKRIFILALLVVVGIVAVFGVTSVVNAQQGTPVNPQPGQGYGRGMMGGYGGMMGGATAQGQGLMHDYMQKELAAKLGITVEDLQAAYTSGQTFWQVAEAKGFTTEQAQQMMIDARGAAFDKMVADGVMTKEQADWMKTRMNGATMGQGGCGGTGTGPGMMGGNRGGRNW